MIIILSTEIFINKISKLTNNITKIIFNYPGYLSKLGSYSLKILKMKLK